MSRPGEVLQAAVDVASDWARRLYPGHQVFVFGPKGTPFWAKRPVVDGELVVLRRAVEFLERQNETRAKPYAANGESGLFSAMALDAEGELFAVVVHGGPKDLPAETRRAKDRTAMALQLPSSGRKQTRD
jgi:hypothetical protein